jgi:hypothetical protein
MRKIVASTMRHRNALAKHILHPMLNTKPTIWPRQSNGTMYGYNHKQDLGANP